MKEKRFKIMWTPSNVLALAFYVAYAVFFLPGILLGCAPLDFNGVYYTLSEVLAALPKSSFLTLLFLAMLYLVIPTVLTLTFVFSARKGIRLICIAVSLVLPLAVILPLVFRVPVRAWPSHFIFVCVAPFCVIQNYWTALAGESHDGEWWQENVGMLSALGALGFWFLVWAIVSLLEWVKRRQPADKPLIPARDDIRAD